LKYRQSEKYFVRKLDILTFEKLPLLNLQFQPDPQMGKIFAERKLMIPQWERKIQPFVSENGK
jgi:hypothetical protein